MDRLCFIPPFNASMRSSVCRVEEDKQSAASFEIVNAYLVPNNDWPKEVRNHPIRDNSWSFSFHPEYFSLTVESRLERRLQGKTIKKCIGGRRFSVEAYKSKIEHKAADFSNEAAWAKDWLLEETHYNLHMCSSHNFIGNDCES